MRDNLISSNTWLLNAVSVLMVRNQCMLVLLSVVSVSTCTHVHTHHMCSHSHSIICEVVRFIIFISSSGGLSTAHADL